MPMIDSVVERFKPVRQIDGTTGSRLLCRTERFLIFERRFYSDDPLRAQELEPSEGWCEFVVSLRPPDPQHLTCPRTQYADARYLHHHLVVRVEPDYLRHLLAPEAERVLEELLPFVRGEAPLPDQLYLMTANPLVRSVVDSLLHPPPVGSLRLFYEAKLRELMAFLCFREPAVVASQDASRLHQAIAYLEAHFKRAGRAAEDDASDGGQLAPVPATVPRGDRTLPIRMSDRAAHAAGGYFAADHAP
jgi:hypothetical protein